jgi:hypothetical protein
MNCWIENYGEDADGNRGVKTVFWELDDSAEEREEIVEAIYDDFKDGESDGCKTVYLTCSLLDDKVEEVISICDYIEDLIAMAKEDDDYKTDAEFKEYIDGIEVEIKVKKAFKKIDELHKKRGESHE